MSAFLATPDFPYCKGCGHHLVARNTVRALESLGVRPLDVVLVTDIGCHGIIDRCFTTHTVHGLHGRSVALGTGIAMSLPPEKKVIVYVGDGGATIGLQHLLEAARLNVNLTVVVHNNMLYGMTGGQPSGLTPCGFRTVITPEGNPLPHHDLCRLVHDAGAAYVCRVIGQGDFSTTLREAMEVEGFALVDVLELCTGHATKMNPHLRLRELARRAGCEPGVWRNDARTAFCLPRRKGCPSLLDIEGPAIRFESQLDGSMSLVIGGQAGEGVQRASELFVLAAMATGLHVTRKGSYATTVGVGFSSAEVIASRTAITYHGISQPDAAIITAADGLQHNLNRIREMESGIVWIDASLCVPETGAEVRVRDFRGRAGPRNAALYSLLTFVRETGLIPVEALVETMRESPAGRHVPAELLEDAAP